MAAYQFACDQFGFPTIPNLWGLSGATKVPWWAWLLFAQLGFNYGLFEYVRRQPVALETHAPRIEEAQAMKGADLARLLHIAREDARAAIADNPTQRSAEQAWPALRAAMLTAHKERGLALYTPSDDPMVNVEWVCRLFEKVGPLIARGHDEEARHASQEHVDRIEKARARKSGMSS